MYTWEIENYLKERNFEVNRNEFLKVVSRVENPQILDVRPVSTNTFNLITSDDGNLTFKVK